MKNLKILKKIKRNMSDAESFSKVEPVNQWLGSSRLSDEQVKSFYHDHINWLSNWDYQDVSIQDKYFIRASEIKNESGWNSKRCEIHTPHRRTGEMMIDQSIKIGEYKRCYHSFAEETFHPFHKNGQDYALYSPNYTSTRIMKLPECKDIGGEEQSSRGFCPVNYLVPCKERNPNQNKTLNVDFGFVKGCAWGDDSTMKVQYIDLSNVKQGEIERKPEKLGYHELPIGVSLEDAVNLEFYDDDDEHPEWENMISVASFRMFHVDAEKNFHVQHDGLSEEKKKEEKEFVEHNSNE